MKHIFFIIMIVLASTFLFSNNLEDSVFIDDVVIQEQPDTIVSLPAQSSRDVPRSIPWDVIITFGIAVIGWLGLGRYWLVFKNVTTGLRNLFQTIQDAISDDTITNRELKLILRQIRDIIQAFSIPKKLTPHTNLN